MINADPLHLIAGDGFTAIRRGTCADQPVLFDSVGRIWTRAAIRRDLAILAAAERTLVAAIEAGRREYTAGLRILWDLEGRYRVALAQLDGTALPMIHRTGLSIMGDVVTMICWTCSVTLTRPPLDSWSTCERWEEQATAFHRAHPSAPPPTDEVS